MTSAKVYRIVGDPALGEAIKSGMEAAEPVKERDTLTEAREGVKKPREIKTWKTLIETANENYGVKAPPRGLCKWMLVGWAMLWWWIDRAYKRLSAINREA